MTAFDWNNRRALETLFPRDTVPFPYAYLAVAALEYVQGGMLATVQYVGLNSGSLPNRLRLVPISDILTDAYRGNLERALGVYTPGFGLSCDNRHTLQVTAPMFDGVDSHLINAFSTGGKCVDPLAKKRRSFINFGFWGHEALAGDKRVGSFYFFAWHNGYDKPWKPGSRVPPSPSMQRMTRRQGSVMP